MARISEDLINKIRSNADIVSIISKYIPLKNKGKNYFGVCPFHNDHTPSMSVSKDLQLYKCFVCGKGGNVFNFVKDYENISYIEAVKKVADIVGIPLEIDNYNNKDNLNKAKVEYEIMELATKIYQNNLYSEEGISAREYLRGRSISDEVIKEFRIGLSSQNKTFLTDTLSKKYNTDKLEELGLINKNGLNIYDKFIKRIMIPIIDENNNILGYTGRIFDTTDSAKYINSQESPIYKKGLVLFNYQNAKKYALSKKELIIVEGNMDAIRLYTSGIKNVIALMGTVITKEQINLISKLRCSVTLILDNDAAGETATLNVGDLLDKVCDVKVVRLSKAKDPDEYIVNYGIDNFLNVLDNKVDYLDYKINILKKDKDLTKMSDLITFIREISDYLNNSNKDKLTKEVTLNKLCEEYKIDINILKNNINMSDSNIKNNNSISNSSIKQKKQNNYDICSKHIIYYLMSDKKYIRLYNNMLGFLEKEEERNLVAEIEYYLEKYDTISVADFLTYSYNEINIKELVNNIIESVSFEELSESIFLEYVYSIKNIMRKNEINRLKKELRNTLDVDRQMEISKQINEIKIKQVKKV